MVLDRGLRPGAAGADARPGQAAGAEALGEVLQLVDLAAGQLAGVFGGQAPALHHAVAAARGQGGAEHLDPAAVVAADDLGQVDQRQAEAQVGLVVAVLAGGLGVGHALERAGRCSTPSTSFHSAAIRSSIDVLHVLLDDEAHLEVDLGELGLAVEAQVLVAEAAHDLEVAVEAGHHEQLLEDLRRFGQGVELARVQPRGHQEVAGAARRVLHHERRLDLQEAVLGQHAPGGLVDRRAQQEVLLQRRAGAGRGPGA